MTPFQWICCSTLTVLAVREIVQLARAKTSLLVGIGRLLVWTLAASAMLYPQVTTWLANVVGVARGADLIFYLLCLTFLVTSFFFYAQYSRISGELTELVRHIAIREARRGQISRDDHSR